MPLDECESLEKKCCPLEEKERIQLGDSQIPGKLGDVELPNDQEFIFKYFFCSFSTEQYVVVNQNLDLALE